MSFGEPPLTVGIDGVQVPITSRNKMSFRGPGVVHDTLSKRSLLTTAQPSRGV